MRTLLLRATGAAALATAIAACQPADDSSANEAGDSASPQTLEATETMQAEITNPLLAEWDGPYGGVPAFDEMDLGDLAQAIRVGIERRAADYEAIASNPEPATFENTIVAMERAGADLDRVFTYWGLWSSNLSSPEFRELQAELAPEISTADSAITQNQDLFARVRAVHAGDEMASLRSDQQRLVQLSYDSFARNGATLTGEAAERYAAIQLRLSELHTQFSNNVLADEEGYVTYLTGDQLAGLPESFVESAASMAAERGREGEYAVLNTRSSIDPFLIYSEERGLREQVWRTFYNRGDNGDANDNNAIIAEILQLRHERVQLLGYDNYAQWRLENRMAGTPERAMDLMRTVWPAALGRVEQEVAQMEAVAAELGDDIGAIEPWDYRYYMEKVRQREYDLNSEEVKQYFSIDALREAMFFVSGELFGFAFEEITDGSVPVFHEDVRVWDVTDVQTDAHIGLWYLDPFARPGKRSGAWATSYRDHTTFDGEETVLASNNSNFIEGAPGEPVLISFDDATTFFHEMGHALHYLSSNVAYPTLNSGVRDYTEFQSQLLERWVLTDEVINRFLRHAETGEPMPADMVERIRAASTFNEGFGTTEYLASALMDMAYHTTDPAGIDPDAFERETLEELGMPSELPMRHRSPHFSHIFSGEGYSAGYYSYMWADVLTSDAAEAFAEAPGGFYDENLAARMVETLFAPRNAVDPAEAYRQFRGRDATVEPLMRDRGFPVPGEDE